jgi:hypothetical protein
MELSWDGSKLRWSGREADSGAVTGFSEHFDRWSGRAWLVVHGPEWRVPIAEGYGPVRASLRESFSDRPWVADWMDGRFPASPAGLPPDLAFALGTAVLAIGVAAAVATIGPAGAALVGFAGALPVARLRDGVNVHKEGLRIGPAWAPLLAWHEVDGLCVRQDGNRVRVWARGGSAVVRIPAVLLPALKARVRRLGGLELEATSEGLDERYDRWRAPATSIPWGVLSGSVLAAFLSPRPWTALTAGLLATAGTALLGATVEARATGWGSGAVLWATGAYAVVLAALALGVGGWIGV